MVDFCLDGSEVSGEGKIYWLEPNVTEVGSDRSLTGGSQTIPVGFCCFLFAYSTAFSVFLEKFTILLVISVVWAICSSQTLCYCLYGWNCYYNSLQP